MGLTRYFSARPEDYYHQPQYMTSLLPQPVVDLPTHYSILFITGIYALNACCTKKKSEEGGHCIGTSFSRKKKWVWMGWFCLCLLYTMYPSLQETAYIRSLGKRWWHDGDRLAFFFTCV